MYPHCLVLVGQRSGLERLVILLATGFHCVSLMVRWVVGSILHGVDPLSYFSFQPVLHDWCNNDRGMCYPVSGMVHIKEPLLLIGKCSSCGGSRFPLTMSDAIQPSTSLNRTFPSFLPLTLHIDYDNRRLKTAPKCY